MSKKTEPIDVSNWDIVHLNASPDYISEAEFLATNGSHRDRDYTVALMTREPPPDPTQKGTVDILKFENEHKRLIMNKTNKVSISALLGRKPLNWYGKTVTLFFDTTEKFKNPKTGKLGNGAIRVRPTLPKQKAKTAE